MVDVGWIHSKNTHEKRVSSLLLMWIILFQSLLLFLAENLLFSFLSFVSPSLPREEKWVSVLLVASDFPKVPKFNMHARGVWGLRDRLGSVRVHRSPGSAFRVFPLKFVLQQTRDGLEFISGEFENKLAKILTQWFITLAATKIDNRKGSHLAWWNEDAGWKGTAPTLDPYSWAVSLSMEIRAKIKKEGKWGFRRVRERVR